MYLLNILNMLHILRFFFSSRCRLFHNAMFFGSCNIHILNTGCAKILKKIPAPKDHCSTFRRSLSPSYLGWVWRKGTMKYWGNEIYRLGSSLIQLSVLRQIHSHFQIQFSTQCDLVFPLSVHSTLIVPLRPSSSCSRSVRYEECITVS